MTADAAAQDDGTARPVSAKATRQHLARLLEDAGIGYEPGATRAQLYRLAREHLAEVVPVEPAEDDAPAAVPDLLVGMATARARLSAAKLREPFPPSSIGQIPRKGGVRLDYVGHAAVTDRLLSVDPAWSWEPFAVDADGLPAVTYTNGGKEANLWIRLTVAGVTRPEVGTEVAGADDLLKKLVSDALRRSAMRFGVALDLWGKEDLHAAAGAPPRLGDRSPDWTDGDEDDPPPNQQPIGLGPVCDPADIARLRARIARLSDEGRAHLKVDWDAARAARQLVPVANLTVDLLARAEALVAVYADAEGIPADPTEGDPVPAVEACWGCDGTGVTAEPEGEGPCPVCHPARTGVLSEPATSAPEGVCPECGHGAQEDHAEGCSRMPF